MSKFELPTPTFSVEIIPGVTTNRVVITKTQANKARRRRGLPLTKLVDGRPAANRARATAKPK